MAKTTFKKIVIMTIPEKISSTALLKSLKDLVKEVKGANVTGILVDVTALSLDQPRFKSVGAATGPPARETIDPALYKAKVKKVAFVEPSGQFHGREPGPLPLLKRGAPAKNYFTDHLAAMTWLRS